MGISVNGVTSLTISLDSLMKVEAGQQDTANDEVMRMERVKD